ncbi:hypothetical protein [Marinicellulosiphila megalodicopiae]|uniref:hypothetical protein n=1 Tax=Marinicellulosiphila megalodicopiae TaxID=2724896 RepID=UPI003BB13B3E
MENHEFLKNWAQRTWTIWGSKLTLNYPTLETEGHKFVDTQFSEPGRESFEFYDGFFDIAQKDSVDLFDIDDKNRIDELKKIDGDTGNLLCFRRRFINTWYPELEGIKESFFADTWVVRNANQKSLLDPNNLQNAELLLEQLLRKENADDYENVDDDIFDDGCDEVHFSAIQWRTETVNGNTWQCYDEYNADDKIAQVLLYPLGDAHYLKLRLYHMNVREYAEFQTLFDKFCQKIKTSIKLEPLHPIAETKLSQLDASRLDMSKAAQEKWKAFDAKVRAAELKGYQNSVPIHIPVPQNNHHKSGMNTTWFILVLIVFVFGLIISGMFKTLHWFTLWEVPLANIMFGLMIANLAVTYFLAKISGRLDKH